MASTLISPQVATPLLYEKPVLPITKSINSPGGFASEPVEINPLSHEYMCNPLFNATSFIPSNLNSGSSKCCTAMSFSLSALPLCA